MQNSLYAFVARKVDLYASRRCVAYLRRLIPILIVQFQITPPGSPSFTSIAWMLNRGYVAVGGPDGTLRIMLLNLEHDYRGGAETSASPWLSCQQLEGHTPESRIVLLCWNEVYQKLASSDDAGLIIVWMNHGSSLESWFEEMINNRQQSKVTSLKWSNDGSRIAIAYEDGQVIVGSVDGNRLWNKGVNAPLSKIAWSPDDTLLLLGLVDGEVHVYDQDGEFQSKLTVLCEPGGEVDRGQQWQQTEDTTIVALEWYTPAQPCRVPAIQRQRTEHVHTSMYMGIVPDNRPRLLIAYHGGHIQLMPSESSPPNAVIVMRIPLTQLMTAQWSPDGSMFAVAGLQMDLPENDRNVLYLISAEGQQMQSIRLAAGRFGGIAWESTGLRVAALIDVNIFLLVLKLPYKWAYCGQTLVYSYCCSEGDSQQETVVFFETKMEMKAKRYLPNVSCIRGNGNQCLVVFRSDELRGAYTLQMCDSIGTPVGQHSIDIPPDFVDAANGVVVVATWDCFTLWQYDTARSNTMSATAMTNNPLGWDSKAAKAKAAAVSGNQHQEDLKTPPAQGATSNGKLFYIDQPSGADGTAALAGHKTTDLICAVACSPKLLIVGRDSGAIHCIRLPDVRPLSVIKDAAVPSAKILALNCSDRKLALISKHHAFRLYELEEEASSIRPIQGLERKEVWSLMWDKVGSAKC